MSNHRFGGQCSDKSNNIFGSRADRRNETEGSRMSTPQNPQDGNEGGGLGGLGHSGPLVTISSPLVKPEGDLDHHQVGT